MVFKVNISEKSGKTHKIETDSEALVGRKIGEIIKGNDISSDLNGFEFEITGTSDKAGFAGKTDEEGPALKRVLFTKGKFLKRVPHKGFRRKKTVRGNTVSLDTIQINTIIKKEGGKKLEEIIVKEEKKK